MVLTLIKGDVMNFSLLLPKQFDNQYRGNKIALWMFVVITLIFMGRSLIHVFAADGGAQSIATIPLDLWSADAAKTLISMFAFWGLVQVMMAGLNIVALVRYKSMIPLLYLVMVITQLGRIGIGQWKPVVTQGTAPAAALTFYLLAFLTLGLLLSLIPNQQTQNRSL